MNRSVGRMRSTVWRWGNSGSTPLQSASSELSKKPAAVPGLTRVDGKIQSLSNGLDHSAVVFDGRLLTFGSNKYSQLGRNVHDTNGDSVAKEAEASTSSPVVSVSCGGWHSVNLHENGSVSSFGWGGSFFSGAGGLGLGSKHHAVSPTMLDIPERVVQVACGNQHTLFLTESGKLFATGHGAYGILGTGDTSDELLPVNLSSSLEASLEANEKIIKIACGASFSSFITDAGNIYVWGRNDSGQLGLGEESQGDMHSAERYPRRISFFETERTFIKDVACGENNVVALAQNGAIYYWGDRTWLEPHVVSLPEANGGLKGVVKIAAGTKSCFALTESGVLYTWGAKSKCLVLDDIKGSIVTPRPIQPAVFGFQKVIDIAAGRQRCLAATSDNEFIATSPEEAEYVKKMSIQESQKN